MFDVNMASTQVLDHDRSAILKTTSQLRGESLLESVNRAKKELSTPGSPEYKESIRKMRVEKLEFQREFLKLATALNKLINEEIRQGEEQEDMQASCG